MHWRLPLLLTLAFGALVLLLLVSRGMLGLVALGGALLAGIVLLWPLVGLIGTVASNMLWVIGAIAPGGLSILGPSKLFSLLTLAAWLRWALQHRVSPTRSPHMVPLAAFAVVVLLAPYFTPARQDSFVGIGKHVMLFLPYLLVANLAVSRQAILAVCAAVSATATCAAIIAVGEYALPGVELVLGQVQLGAVIDDASLRSAAIKRVSGGIGDANWFSYTMVTALPLNLFWLRHSRSPASAMLAIAMAGLQALGIVLSFTRTPLLALAGATAYLIWKRRIALTPLLAAGLVALVAIPLWMPPGFAERIFSLRYLREGSTPIRAEIVTTAVDLIAERPLLGHGYQQFGPLFLERTTSELGLELRRRDQTGDEPAHLLRAHNAYLDVAVQYGIAGLAPFLFFCGLLLWELAAVERRGSPPDAELAVILSACLIAFLLCGIGGHSQELKIFWILGGVVAGLRRVVLCGEFSMTTPMPASTR